MLDYRVLSRAKSSLVLWSFFMCANVGCQENEELAQTQASPKKQIVIERLPNEPDDLSAELPESALKILRERFPGYTLPLSKVAAVPEPASKPAVQSKYFREINGKPIAEAIYNGKTAEAARLIGDGKPLDAVHEGHNLLHLAAQRGQKNICRLLLDAGMDVHQMGGRADDPKRTPVQLAIGSGSIETVELLLARGGKFTPADNWGDLKKKHIPLASLAVRSCQPEMLSFLIERGRDADDIQLLFQAISYCKGDSRRQIVAQLLDAGVRWKPKDKDLDPFVPALETGDLELVRLIETKIPSKFGEPHLRAAVQSGDFATAQYVVSKGARADAKPSVSKELLRIALVDHGSIELADLVVSAGEEKKYCAQSKESTSYCSRRDFAHPLYHAVMAGDLSLCRYLIREFSSDDSLWAPIIYDPYEYENDIEFFLKGNTVLFAAVYNDDAQALNLLLKYTQPTATDQPPLVDINAKNANGTTVLHEAVSFGAVKCVQLLLAQGADPKIAQKNGCTPLHLATKFSLAPHQHTHHDTENQTQIFPMLASAVMAQDAKDWLQWKNDRGETILHCHAQAVHPWICSKLVEFGADINAVDNRGQTPLHLAIGAYGILSREKRRRTETCSVLMQLGTEVDQQDVRASYLRLAAARDLDEVYEILLEKGDPNLAQNGGSLLCSAAKHGNKDRIERLLTLGADVNARDGHESTALHQAARIKDLEICKLLIENGANVNAKDRQDQTPLFEVFDRWAIYPEHLQHKISREKAMPVLRLLLKNGADTSVQTRGTNSTIFCGTVLEVYKYMPQEFRDVLRGAQE